MVLNTQLSKKTKDIKNPTVTVLMSVYNGEKYLYEAIESILNQTFKDFEFLIINDGSTDGTAKILQSYQDHRIKIINNEKNIGLTKSLNKGLRFAKGEYIARMDADDISMPERLEKELEFMEAHRNYAVVGTFLNVLDEDSKVVGTIEKPIGDDQIREFLKKDNCIGHGSAMVRKKSLLNIGYYNESIEKAQDYDLWLRISERYKMANIPQYLYMWRNYKENISAKHNNEQKHFVEMIKARAEGRKEKKRGYYSNHPKFSVLMANYNNGKYILEAIQSVLDQTFKDWELVIVDDCSTDNSIEKIKPYLEDERIQLFKNNVNMGYISTLKRLIYESRAEILGILDSDDVLTSDALRVMYDAHKNNPNCGFIHSQFIWCDSKLNPKSRGYCDSIPPSRTNLHYDCVSAFRTFKKRDYFKTEGYDEKILYAEDQDLSLKMEEVTNLLFIDKILYKHRVLPHSQSHDPQKNQIGLNSFALAKYNAYKRRLNTNIPNVTRKEMANQLLDAIFLCIKLKKLKKAIFFLSRALKLYPLNFRGYKDLCSRVAKLVLHFCIKKILKKSL